MSRRDLGKFRHRVTFYTVTRVEDLGGGFTRSDPSSGTELGTFWADVIPLSGRELLRAQKLEEDITHQVTVRYNSGFVNGQIMKFDGRYFYIITVIDSNNLKEFLNLMCREGGPL